MSVSKAINNSCLGGKTCKACVTFVNVYIQVNSKKKFIYETFKG